MPWYTTSILSSGLQPMLAHDQLSFDQRPFGQFSDDLNLVVTLPNGTQYETNDSLEGTEALRINLNKLNGVEWVTVKVKAKNVGIGNYTEMLGNDGDKVGFALAVSGVEGIKINPVLGNDELCCTNTSEDNGSFPATNVGDNPDPVFEKGEWGGDKVTKCFTYIDTYYFAS